MKTLKLLFIIFTAACNVAYGQYTMHDFSVTDVHGQQHRLYEGYLNQGKVVVIKFFFTSCPPCIANAPLWQQKYVQWGSGNQGVEFFSVTTLISDYNPNVLAFESNYNQSMKGISQDGGAQVITNPFKNEVYGPWWGTPSFVVIAPDRSMVYPVFFNNLDAAINTAKTKTGVVPTSVNLNVNTHNVDIPEGHVKFFISPKGSATPKIEIKKNAEGEYAFTYPSSGIPEMLNPEIKMESFGPAYTNKITASDLLVIQKHILGITALDAPYKNVAADVNGDAKITASDLLNIKKIILGLSISFPNNTPSYKSLPASVDLTASPGNLVSPEFTVIKIGNVN